MEIQCGNCNQALEIEDQYANMAFDCPTCGANNVPEIETPVNNFVQNNDTNPCPMCGEDIKKIAKICKHCGEILDHKLKKQKVKENPKIKEKKKTGCLGIGCVSLIIIVVFVGILSDKGSEFFNKIAEESKQKEKQEKIAVGVNENYSYKDGVDSSKSEKAQSYMAGKVIRNASPRFYANDFVKRFLKSPSTAKFTRVNENSVKWLGDNKFRCPVIVDSQNGFGAMIRSRYLVAMTYQNERWTLDTIIDGSGKVIFGNFGK